MSPTAAALAIVFGIGFGVCVTLAFFAPAGASATCFFFAASVSFVACAVCYLAGTPEDES